MNFVGKLSTNHLNCSLSSTNEYILKEAYYESEEIYKLNITDDRQGYITSNIFNIKFDCKICSKTSMQ
jgi:hypothetical protein